MTNYNDKMVSMFPWRPNYNVKLMANEVNTNLHRPDCDVKTMQSNITTGLGSLHYDVKVMGKQYPG